MANTHGNAEPDIDGLDSLADLPFQALVRALERLFPDAPAIGSTANAAGERVRFRATPTLGFPAAEISALAWTSDHPPRVDVFTNHLGLFGPSSPLPAHVTERVLFAEGSGALADFLDFFNHRFNAALALVLRRYRYHDQYAENGEDIISDAVAALFGYAGMDERKRRIPLPLLLPYAGLLALPSRSASVIRSIVKHATGLDIQIEEFVPREIMLPEDEQFRPGVSGLVLGETTIAGEAIADVGGHFRIHVDELSWETLSDLLPGGALRRQIDDLLSFAIRDPLEWSYVLALKPGESQGLVLGEARMGWTSWLSPDPETSPSCTVD